MKCKRTDCHNPAVPGYAHCGRFCAKVFGEQVDFQARAAKANDAETIAFRDAQAVALEEAGLWISEFYRLESEIKASR